MTGYIYKTSNGEIVKRYDTTKEERIIANLRTGEDYVLGFVEGADDLNSYVLNGVVTSRPEMTPTVNGLVITGLPVPCSLTTYGNTYEVTDGEVTLTYDLAGEYLVEVQAFPYLDWEVTVIAN